MIDHNCNKEYASKSVGTAGLTTGIVGAGLSTLNILQNGGLGNLFGGNQTTALQQQVVQLTSEVSKLEGQKYTDAQVSELYKAQNKDNKELTAFLFGLDKRVTAVETAAPLREQILRGEIAQVASSANCCCNALTAQLQALQTTFANITKTVVPNSSVCPGWDTTTTAAA